MTEPIVQHKQCSKCKITKPTTEFRPRKDRPSGCAFFSWCRLCHQESVRDYQKTPKGRTADKRSKARESYKIRRNEHRRLIYSPEKEKLRKRNYKPDPEKRKQYKAQYNKSAHAKKTAIIGALRRKYGITIELFEKLLSEQRGVCAICGMVNSRNRRLAVDHDHQTGKVRGLLCTPCNTLLGRWKDSPEIAERAKQYLLKHAQLRLVS